MARKPKTAIPLVAQRETIVDARIDAMEFILGDIVFHRLDPENRGIVTGIFQRPGSIMYYVTWSDKSEKVHFALELTHNQKWNVGD